jgi:hypothetical protein
MYILKSNVVEIGIEIFLAIMKAQQYKGGGRILLGDKTRGGAITLQPIRFWCIL